MKLKHTNVESFQPLDITITIESEEELHTLWHLFNVSANEMRSRNDEGDSNFYTKKVNTSIIEQAWYYVENIAIARRLKQ